MNKEIDRNIHVLYIYTALNISTNININVHIQLSNYEWFLNFNLKSCEASLTCLTAYSNECNLINPELMREVFVMLLLRGWQVRCDKIISPPFAARKTSECFKCIRNKNLIKLANGNWPKGNAEA